MKKMFLSPSTSKDSADDLVDIFSCPFDEVTLPMLGATLFEQGRLAPSRVDIHPSDPVALGDVGYVTEDGGFVVVDNIHHYLQAEAGTLSWKMHMGFRSGGKFLEDTSAESIVSPSGNSYQRQRQVHIPVSSDIINQITYFRLFPLTIPAQMHMYNDLYYENLDEMHAWKVLQHDAHSIIAQHGLSIAPHELIIGQWRYTSRKSF